MVAARAPIEAPISRGNLPAILPGRRAAAARATGSRDLRGYSAPYRVLRSAV